MRESSVGNRKEKVLASDGFRCCDCLFDRIKYRDPFCFDKSSHLDSMTFAESAAWGRFFVPVEIFLQHICHILRDALSLKNKSYKQDVDIGILYENSYE